MRLLFVADEHGSVVVLRKALGAVKQYSADVLILSGDLCGKKLVPIVKRRDGEFYAGHRWDETFAASGIDRVERELADGGDYFFHCREQELDRIKSDPLAIERLFQNAMVERLVLWKTLITSALDLRRTTVLVTPGNDDPLELDQALASFESESIHTNLESCPRVGRNSIVTLDYTPPTPWGTPREAEEHVLQQIVERRVASVADPARAIFSFHCPPSRTRLDLVAELDKERKPVRTIDGPKLIHVGSTAVRRAIEVYKPALALHGHIHEAPGEERVGGTLCLNPGSEYWNGILHAYVVDFNEDGTVANCHRIEG